MSAVSSTGMRAQARAEAAAALKKAETEKKIAQIEAQSALLLEQEELTFSRKKREEEARITCLRLVLQPQNIGH